MPTTPSSKYRPEIDGLRAFAVVAVIINHFNKDLLPSGYLGVDIFFVISGYVITSSLAGRESKNFLDFLTGFYERRIKRLVPALVVFVLITSILICLFNPNPGPALGLGWRSLFGISNINLYRSSTDYFAQSTELNPFTHTWSLAVEEQFYLLFPFLIWFSGFGQQTAKGARNLFFWVGTLTIASLISFIYLYQVNQPAAYFLMPPRFWEMAAGCLLFIGFQKRARIEQALEQVPPLLVVAAMVGVMFLPVPAAVPATIGVVVLTAVLIACLKQGTATYKFFTLEKVVYVGLISYSLYLWHWTVLSISHWTIGVHWWLVPIQVGLMLLLAIGSYLWVETPYRRRSWLPLKWLSILGGFIVLLIGVGSIRVISRFAGLVYLGGAQRGASIYSEKIYWNHDQCVGDMRDEFVPGESVFANCNIISRSSNGNGVRPGTFWYGDSYNEQLMPAAAKVKSITGLYMNSYAQPGCPATLEMEYSGERVPGYCAKTFKKYIDYLLSHGDNGAMLILSTNLDYWAGPENSISPFSTKGDSLTFGEARKLHIAELIKLSEMLRKRNIFLAVSSGIPVLEADPDICSSSWSAMNSMCASRFSGTVQKMNDLYRRIHENVGMAERNLFFLDLYSPLKEIMSKREHLIYHFYLSRTHLSRKGALLLVPTLTKAITAKQ
jgi:peptidoglycan/LPS O-acetylase OafA/YrhL